MSTGEQIIAALLLANLALLWNQTSYLKAACDWLRLLADQRK